MKFIDDIEDRMLYEILYNIPPLYHIDEEKWEKHKSLIVNHYNVWGDFSKKVINKEMVDFENLESDGSVKMTQYGDDIKVIANFTDSEYDYGEIKISPKSVLIKNDNGE